MNLTCTEVPGHLVKMQTLTYLVLLGPETQHFQQGRRRCWYYGPGTHDPSRQTRPLAGGAAGGPGPPQLCGGSRPCSRCWAQGRLSYPVFLGPDAVWFLGLAPRCAVASPSGGAHPLASGFRDVAASTGKLGAAWFLSGPHFPPEAELGPGFQRGLFVGWRGVGPEPFPPLQSLQKTSTSLSSVPNSVQSTEPLL